MNIHLWVPVLQLDSTMLAIYFCLLVALSSGSVLAGEISDGLTDKEFQRIFHRSRDDIPKYKTATLKTFESHRSKREVRPVEFDVDGDKIQLQLTPIKHNSVSKDIPVWTVETDYEKSSRHTYKKIDQKEIDYDGIFYEDEEKMALMLAYYRNEYIYYDGVFGESELTKVIRSVPEKWWETTGNQSYNDHVVFDVNQDKSDTEAIGESDHTSDSEKLDKPLDVLYPKLLLVVEYNCFQALGENLTETIKYVATFWNAVNLKYSKLTSPKVNIVITGIIIAKDHSALEYIYAARIPPAMTQVNHLALMNGGNKYFSEEFRNEVDFHNYDSTITMANLDTGVVAGSAFIGQICGDSLNIGFTNDDSSFSGILTATHELGHLLNLPHDGIGAAQHCNNYPNDRSGFVMAPYVASVEKFIWSECSKRILYEFSSTKAAECMRYPYRED